jgi:hypothetical protein
MILNSTLYNCKGNAEIVTKTLSPADTSSSKTTISLHFFNNTTKDALYDRKIDIATEGLEYGPLLPSKKNFNNFLIQSKVRLKFTNWYYQPVFVIS